MSFIGSFFIPITIYNAGCISAVSGTKYFSPWSYDPTLRAVTGLAKNQETGGLLTPDRLRSKLGVESAPLRCCSWKHRNRTAAGAVRYGQLPTKPRANGSAYRVSSLLLPLPFVVIVIYLRGGGRTLDYYYLQLFGCDRYSSRCKGIDALSSTYGIIVYNILYLKGLTPTHQ